MNRRPDTFIIGAPKSGTTSLHKYLDLHADVFMSKPKEPAYFAPDVSGTHIRRLIYPRDESRYLALFSNSGAARRAGEGSTNYLMSRRAPELIRAFNPDAHIIAMVRNPVDLLHSFHQQRIANGIEPIGDFASALEADDDRRAGRRLPPHLKGFGVAYRDVARLGEQLERWLAAFGPQVHVIVFDDFVRDPAAAYREVLDFLGLDSTGEQGSFDIHNTSHRTRPLVHAVYRSRPGRWMARTVVPSLFGTKASRLQRMFGARRLARVEAPRSPVGPELRSQLENEFAADVHKLGQLLGRDLENEWFATAAGERA